MSIYSICGAGDVFCHAGAARPVSFTASRSAIVNSLGTMFFLFVGIFVSVMLIVEAHNSFPFLGLTDADSPEPVTGPDNCSVGIAVSGTFYAVVVFCYTKHTKPLSLC